MLRITWSCLVPLVLEKTHFGTILVLSVLTFLHFEICMGKLEIRFLKTPAFFILLENRDE